MYFITGIYYDGETVESGSYKLIGFNTSREEAIGNIFKNDQEIHKTGYNYIVIEEAISAGINPIFNERKFWLRWSKYSYNICSAPEWSKGWKKWAF